MKLPYQVKKKFVVTIAAILISITIFSQVKIPSTWQPGMKLTMSYGGGMRYYSYKLEIKDTGSFMTIDDEGEISNYKLVTSKKDLDSLLYFLKKMHLNNIQSEITGPVDDKGTESIFLTWGDGFISTGENHMQGIAAKDRDYYSAIYNYIYSLAERTKRKVKKLSTEAEE
jgi:hypothetical protein